MTIDTADYQRQGTVHRLETEGESLQTERTTVSLEANVSETTADAIESGDEYRFAGRTVATVTEVTTSDLENTSKIAVDLEVDLVTFNRAGTRTFGRNSLETGSQLVFRTDTYDFHGEIVRRGTPSRSTRPSDHAGRCTRAIENRQNPRVASRPSPGRARRESAP